MSIKMELDMPVNMEREESEEFLLAASSQSDM